MEQDDSHMPSTGPHGVPFEQGGPDSGEPCIREVKTSVFAVISAVLAVIPSPCCLMAVFPVSISLAIPWELRGTVWTVASALPPLVPFVLGYIASNRIRRSNGRLTGKAWAYTAIGVSVFWVLVGLCGLALPLVGY